MRIIWAVAVLVMLVVAGYLLDFLSTTFSGVWSVLGQAPGGGVKPVEGFEEDKFYNYVYIPIFSVLVSITAVWAVLRLATAIRARM